MPPPGEPRPAAERVEAFVGWLEDVARRGGARRAESRRAGAASA